MSSFKEYFYNDIIKEIKKLIKNKKIKEKEKQKHLKIILKGIAVAEMRILKDYKLQKNKLRLIKLYLKILFYKCKLKLV